MVTIAYGLMFLAMAATVAILATGIFSMARGGEFNKNWSNRLMRLRIITQAVAIAMFALGAYLHRYWT
ncbi:MAG: twin transmembrane helix small protein [Pseudomonadota bacterium]